MEGDAISVLQLKQREPNLFLYFNIGILQTRKKPRKFLTGFVQVEFSENPGISQDRIQSLTIVVSSVVYSQAISP